MIRRVILLLVLSGILTAPLGAAVLYDFRQTARSDSQGSTETRIEGRGAIDGSRSRVDFVGGNSYPTGSYIITRKGASKVLMVSPKDKAYVEYDGSKISSRLVSGEISITNVKTKVDKLADHPSVSGFPTDHYRIETTYQITWHAGPLPLTQNVQTIVEKWTTSAFGDVAGLFLEQSEVRTGNPEIDRLIEAEISEIKGLPIRSVTRITTSGAGNLAQSSSRSGGGPTRVHTTEILLSNIRSESLAESFFEVPRGFTKADPNEAAVKDEGKMHILSLESEGGSK